MQISVDDVLEVHEIMLDDPGFEKVIASEQFKKIKEALPDANNQDVLYYVSWCAMDILSKS